MSVPCQRHCSSCAVPGRECTALGRTPPAHAHHAEPQPELGEGEEGEGEDGG